MPDHAHAIRKAISHVLGCQGRLVLADRLDESRELGELASQLSDALEEFEEREDCFQTVKAIAGLIGCGHYHDPDGRANLVNCVDEIADRAALIARAKKSAPPTESPARPGGDGPVRDGPGAGGSEADAG